MNDVGNLSPQRRSFAMIGLCVLVLLCTGAGCSLSVMAGKMLFGDPMIGDDFKGVTGKSLTEKGKKVAVICNTPESVRDEFSALGVELLREICTKMRGHKIDVIPSSKIASWIDDNGGEVGNLNELAQKIEADYIVRIDIDQFSYQEENSPNLFRGRAAGSVTVFEVLYNEQKTAKVKRLSEIYSKRFASVYPVHQAVPADQTSPIIFRKKYMDRVSDEISRLFYRHRAGSDF